MRNRAQRLGLYGGSFDPIHRGHLAPVEEAAAAMGLDEVLFVPACSPPHKPQGSSASAFHRFAMCALAIEPYPRFRLSDYEAQRGGTTYTVETLRHVRATRPESEVFLVLGSDSLAAFSSWRSWQEILDDHRLVVIYREPWDYAALKEGLPAEIAARLAPVGARPGDDLPEEATVFWAGNAPVTITSTWIRNAARAGERLDESLPPAVEGYLRRQRLYAAP